MPMNKIKPTNGHVGKNQLPPAEELIFPVTFHLKTVFDLQYSETENKANIELTLSALGIPFRFLTTKKSSKGNFSSLSFEITINNKPLMEKLYEELKTVPGLKMAL